jgi:type VI secretion system secreted protein VgrG
VERLTDTYKKRKYRVQYGESDFTFLCRMLEDAGISFYFEQQGEETRLVLADAPEAREARPPIHFREDVTTVHGEHVTSVRIGRKVRPVRYTMWDHDYRKDSKYNGVVLEAAAGDMLIKGAPKVKINP